MTTNISRFCKKALLGVALLAPLAIAPATLLADDHNSKSYHDKDHNDDHQWNGNEDRAYKMYNKENHRKTVTFQRLPENQQQNYWGWRHEHSDAQLKINIH
jgi:hypothetical protein